MNRKFNLLLLLLIGTLFCGLMVVSADDDDDKGKPKVTVKSGIRGVTDNDSVIRAGEYESLTTGVDAGFTIEHAMKDAYYSAFMEFIDGDDLMAMFKGDFNRIVRVEGSFNKFVHRLDHDPLSNLFAVKTPKVTRATDFDPGREYGITYSETKMGATFQHPEAPELVFDVNYREQIRTGHKQTRTLSHCANCHVVGYSTIIDQMTRDISASASFNGRDFSLSAEIEAREFQENGPTPMHQYMDVLHPTAYTPVFNDRAVFSDLDGLLPHSLVPDSNKFKAILNATFNAGDYGVLTGGLVYSEVEDEYTNNSMTFTSLRGSYAGKLSDSLAYRFRGTYYTIDNDDYFYDAFEPVAVAGPYVGQTYRERYGAEVDLDRKSAYNRDVVQFDAGLTYRFGFRNTLSLDYRYKNIDREHYAITAAGDTETTINRIKANLTARLSKSTRLYAHAKFEDIEQPFSGPDIAGTINFNPAVVASPLAPGSLQYFQLYAARVVDLSNQPTQRWELKGNLSHKLAKNVSVSATGLYKNSTNDALDFSEWNKEKTMLNANAWFALSPELYGTFSYSYGDETTETLFVLPIFDG